MEYENEVFIITGEELEDVKKLSTKLLNDLPNEPMTALLVITFLKSHMEGVIGKKVKRIKIKGALD